MVTEEVFTLQVQVEANRTAWAALVVHEENLDVEFKVSGTRSSSRSVGQDHSYRDSSEGCLFSTINLGSQNEIVLFSCLFAKQLLFVSFLVGDNNEESAEEQEDPGDGATDEGQEPAGGHRCTLRRDRYAKVHRVYLLETM